MSAPYLKQIAQPQVPEMIRCVGAMLASDDPYADLVQDHLDHDATDATFAALMNNGEIIGYVHTQHGSIAPICEIVLPESRMKVEIMRACLEYAHTSIEGEFTLWTRGWQTQFVAAHANVFDFDPPRVVMQMICPVPLGQHTSGQLNDALTLDLRELHATERARTNAVAHLVALHRRAFSGHPDRAKISDDDLTQQLVCASQHNERVFLARRNGVVAGFVWLKRKVLNSVTTTEIFLLAVDPLLHGKGVGRELIAQAFTSAHEHFATNTLMLYVDESNSHARRLYTQMGFQETGRDLHGYTVCSLQERH